MVFTNTQLTATTTELDALAACKKAGSPAALVKKEGKAGWPAAAKMLAGMDCDSLYGALNGDKFTYR